MSMLCIRLKVTLLYHTRHFGGTFNTRIPMLLHRCMLRIPFQVFCRMEIMYGLDQIPIMGLPSFFGVEQFTQLQRVRINSV